MDPRILVVFVLLSTQQSDAENPGLKFRISQTGLDYVAAEAVRVLSGKVVGQHINNYEGSANVKVGKVQYKFTDLVINSFNPPKSTLSTTPGQGLAWNINDGSLSIHGNWWYRYKLGPIKHHSSGSFDVSANGISFSHNVVMAMAEGRPTISAGSCQASMGDLNVKFHGGDSWLLNLFDDVIERSLKHRLTDIICDEAKKAINVDAAESLSTLDMTVPIGGDAILNYSLISQPTFTSSYMESYHKAEVTCKGDPASSSVKAPPMPDTTSNHMISFWLSDYLMNTLGDVTYKHGTLEKTLTASDLEEKEKLLLNTTCPTGYCIGMAIPPLAQKFPDTSVALEMSASSRPHLVIKENTLEGQFAGIVKYNVLLPDGSYKYAMTTELTLNVTLNVTLTGTDLTAAITNHKLGLNVTDMIEELGPIPSSLNTRMHWFFDIIAYGYITQNLNELGAKGFPLPKIKNVKYVNPSLTIEKGLLGIMTDVKYDPSY